MCGIVGLCLRNGGIDEGEICVLRDSMEHRGPDDAGFWLDPQGRIGLAHRRLSIIDLSAAGHQPMLNEDESVVLIFNGEIYNFQDLKKELQERGHTFRSLSDSEIIIRTYEEWGEEGISRLDGMFAFALLDRPRRRLVLARDRFGEKPLYYYTEGDTFLFASELKAIEAYPSFPRRVQHDLLSLYFTFGNIPSPNSIYQHVFKLPAAHYMVVDTESLEFSVAPYWQGMETALNEEASSEDMETVVSRVELDLSESINRRLIADVPVGAFLSGGVDSSLVVSMASRLKSNLKTFSIGFEDAEHDEAPYARAIANRLGCDHFEHYISEAEAREILVRLPSIYDEPFADSSAIPLYIVSRVARSEVTVALSGDGGDELFAGYSTYPLFARLLPLLKVPGFLKQLASLGISIAGTGKAKKHIDLLRCDELWQLFLYINERTIAKPPDVEKLLIAPDNGLLANSQYVAAFERVQSAGDLNRCFYAEAKTYLADDILTKVDRASMAVSLETRIPFLDSRIAEYAMGLSASTKMGKLGGARKIILRRLLARYLPTELFERPKRGFSVPLARWLRGELRWLVDEHLESGKLKQEGLFNVPFVEQLVAEHMGGRRDREAVLWALIFWQMWRKERSLS